MKKRLHIFWSYGHSIAAMAAAQLFSERLEAQCQRSSTVERLHPAQGYRVDIPSLDGFVEFRVSAAKPNDMRQPIAPYNTYQFETSPCTNCAHIKRCMKLRHNCPRYLQYVKTGAVNLNYPTAFCPVTEEVASC